MNEREGWRGIVAASLDWEQAHTSLDSAVKGLPPGLRGKRPDGLPHSPWELVEHIRRTQYDLLDFCQNPAYEELRWPDDYWPPNAAPPTPAAWARSIAAIRADREALARFATEAEVDLTAKIPHGTGQTYLRTILVATDHAAYHVGQLVMVRQLLGAWPPRAKRKS